MSSQPSISSMCVPTRWNPNFRTSANDASLSGLIDATNPVTP